MMNSEWEMKFVTIYYEANRCADELGSLGCNLQETLILFEQCLPSMGLLFHSDSLRIPIPRCLSY